MNVFIYNLKSANYAEIYEGISWLSYLGNGSTPFQVPKCEIIIIHKLFDWIYFILSQNRNLENNPLLCQCENKWIQEAGLSRNRNRYLDHHWPKISLSSFPRLFCKDAYSIVRQLQNYIFQRCGINYNPPVFEYYDIIILKTITEKPELRISPTHAQLSENASFNALCSASGDPTPMVYANFLRIQPLHGIIN